MMRRIAKAEGKGYEVQWYKDNGDKSDVVVCDTVEELAQYLARSLWGSMRFKQNPTVWYNGTRWCLGEYTAVDSEGRRG